MALEVEHHLVLADRNRPAEFAEDGCGRIVRRQVEDTHGTADA
jgi:hypothetical protein